MSAVEQQTVGNTRPAKKARRPVFRLLLFRLLTVTHVFLYRRSGGRIGERVLGQNILLLTTTGRKTGKLRTIPLIYHKDDNSLILVASYGGSPTPPIWWLNLQAKPEAQVEIGRQKLAVVTRQADGEERKRLWPLLVAMFPGYALFQRRVTHEIPVVILSPQSRGGSV